MEDVSTKWNVGREGDKINRRDRQERIRNKKGLTWTWV